MNHNDPTELRIGLHVFTTTPVGAMIRLDIHRNVESPVFRETIPLYFSPEELRDFIGLLTVSLDAKPSDQPHATRLRGICERVREKFSPTIPPVQKFEYSAEVAHGGRTIAPFTVPIKQNVYGFIGPKDGAA